MASSIGLCSHCHTPLAATAGGRLCPACSLEQVLLPEDEPETDAVFPRPFGGYELLGEVGRGGMGLVFRARQLSLDRILALKVLLYGPFGDKVSRQRFRAEAELAARLQHPNIVALHEVGEEDGVPYLTMDLVDGPDLGRLCAGHPLPAEVAGRHLRDIARAVQAAHHAGVLHRDLKPSNILVGSDGRARVTDFGLAKRQDAANGGSLTATGQVLGSPSYASPEQAAGRAESAGPAGDVYGLGAVLYHLVTGRAPFVAATAAETFHLVLDTEPVSPRALNPALPRDLETICLKCLQKDPARRYATAAAVAEELDRFLEGRPIRARPMSPTERAWRWCCRHPAVAALSSTLIVVLATTAGLARFQTVHAERTRQLAESARTEGEKLVTFMLDDMYRNVDATGRRDQVADLAHQAVTYYENLPPEQRSRETDLRRAQALSHYGYALTAQMKLSAAQVPARQAVAILEQLRYDGDETDATLIALTTALNREGRLQEAMHDRTGANATFARAVAAVEARAHRPNALLAVRRVYAVALTHLGAGLSGFPLLQRPEAQQRATALLEQARAIQADLPGIDATAIDFMMERATTLHALALLAYESPDRRSELEKLLEEVVALTGQVLARQPAHVQALAFQGGAQTLRGMILEENLHFPEARQCLEQAQVNLERAILLDPTDSATADDLHLCRCMVRLLLLREGRIRAALQGWSEELTALAAQANSASFAGAGLVTNRRYLASWQAETGDRAGAETTLRELRANIDRAFEHIPHDDFLYLHHQFSTRMLAAWVADLFGEHERARAEARAALAQIEQLPAADRARQNRAEGRVRNVLASAALRLGAFSEAVTTTEVWKPTEPLAVAGWDYYCSFELVHGIALARLGRDAEARTVLAPVRDFIRKLAAASPGSCGVGEDLAGIAFAEALAQPPGAEVRRRELLAEAASRMAALPDEFRALRSAQELSGWIADEQAKSGEEIR